MRACGSCRSPWTKRTCEVRRSRSASNSGVAAITSIPVTRVAPASSAAKAIPPWMFHMQPTSTNERPGHLRGDQVLARPSLAAELSPEAGRGDPCLQEHAADYRDLHAHPRTALRDAARARRHRASSSSTCRTARAWATRSPRSGTISAGTAARDGGQPRVRDGGRAAVGRRRACADPARVRRGAATAVHARVTDEPLSLDALVARVARPGARAASSPSRASRARSTGSTTRPTPRWRREVIAGIVAAAVERHGAVRRRRPSTASAPSAGRAVGGRRRVGAAPRRGVRGARGRSSTRIKAQAPIWKREVEGESARWVDGTTPAT